MKILVFSDSHGEKYKMLDAIEIYEPQMIIHLGDYHKDAGRIEEHFPKIPLKAIKGNCDRITNKRESDVFFLGGLKFFITHGHYHGVKSGYERIINAALDADASVCLFGHTHRAMSHRLDNGGLLLNPGAVCDGRCALLEIKDGGVDFNFLDI